jgi:geranylgeranyl transferase type-2 subunit alpha
MIGMDERNFHAWNYRNWIIKEVLKNEKKYVENELKFTKEKIDNNFSNFSALHFRAKNFTRKYHFNNFFQ